MQPSPGRQPQPLGRENVFGAGGFSTVHAGWRRRADTCHGDTGTGWIGQAVGDVVQWLTGRESQPLGLDGRFGVVHTDGFRRSGRARRARRTGAVTKRGSLDSPGLVERLTPTGGRGIAAVAAQEFKWRKKGKSSWGGTPNLARRAASSTVPARTRLSDPTGRSAHGGHRYEVRHARGHKGVVEREVLPKAIPHKKRATSPLAAWSGQQFFGLGRENEPPSSSRRTPSAWDKPPSPRWGPRWAHDGGPIFPSAAPSPHDEPPSKTHKHEKNKKTHAHDGPTIGPTMGPPFCRQP
jgi:hypothetical protein